MSNLKNASLILKSNDLFNAEESAKIMAYYYSTTQLVVCTIDGNIPSNVFIKGVSTGTPSNNINTNGYGTIALNTPTTATTAHSSVTMQAEGNLLRMPTATTTSSTVTINDNILTLSTANTNIVVGQFITGYSSGVYIPDNTRVISKIRKLLKRKTSFLKTLTLSFFI
jgi:hypothetical protein